MKRKVLLVILGVEAAACVLLRIAQASFTGAFSSAMAFPFEQIGAALRALSLSGGIGNIAAIVIYAAVSLLPAALLPVLRKKRGLYAEDWLLALLSATLFAVLYLMINPGVISPLMGESSMQSTGKAIFGGIVYSVFCGYLVLRALRMFSHGSTDKLALYMSTMLCLLNALFVYMIFGACFSDMLDSIAKLQAGNAGNEHLLGASYIFLVLQAIVNAIPYALNVIVTFAMLHLLDELRADRYSAETAAAAARVSRLCAAALAVTVLSNIGFNLLQLMFAKSLMVINASLEIPILSIAFVLAALLLTRFVAENKQLKDDNDMFI